MNTFFKKTPIILAITLASMTSVKANDAFSHTVLSLLDDPRVEEPWSRVISSQEDWEEFYNEPLIYTSFFEGEVPTAPIIDFNQYQILTGGMGLKNSGGFQLVVSEVQELEDELNVHVLMIRPSSDCLIPMVISYPSATVLVQKTDKPFRFTVSQLIDECL